MANRIVSRTFKIKRFSISFFSNEIVIVFIGDKNIHIKTIRARIPSRGLKRKRAPRINPSIRTRIPPRKKKLAFALSSAIIAIVLVFSLYPSRQKEAGVVDDETIKKNLLESKQTHYSSPEKSQKLVINEPRAASRASL